MQWAFRVPWRTNERTNGWMDEIGNMTSLVYERCGEREGMVKGRRRSLSALFDSVGMAIGMAVGW